MPITTARTAFDFTVNDGHGGNATASITITVSSVNDAPVATGGSVTTPEDTPVNFQLGASDIESDPLTFTVTGPPADGNVVCSSAGACTYTPPANFSGSAVVRYDVSDGQLTDSGVFGIQVDPQNDPPVAANSSASTLEDTGVTIPLNATDTENDTLTYVVQSPPSHGTLVCANNGNSCVYTPGPNYYGADSFVWSADDGHAGQSTATVSITVTAVNDAPRALDVSAATDEEVPTTFTLLANDVDGDPITYAIDTPPTNGSVTITGNQATYTPAIDFNGVDTFMFKASDPSGASTVARATITVDGLPLIATLIVPGGATANVEIKLGVPLNSRIAVLQLSATLWKSTGTRFANRTLNFFVGTTLVCTGVTNANGFATCGSNAQGLAATLNLGYRVTFDGDADYSASAANGPLVVVNAVRL